MNVPHKLLSPIRRGERWNREICPLSINVRAESSVIFCDILWKALWAPRAGTGSIKLASFESSADPWELSTQKALQKPRHYARQFKCLPFPPPALLPFSGVPPRWWRHLPLVCSGRAIGLGVPVFSCWGCSRARQSDAWGQRLVH